MVVIGEPAIAWTGAGVFATGPDPVILSKVNRAVYIGVSESAPSSGMNRR
jgi:hypothetical protein